MDCEESFYGKIVRKLIEKGRRKIVNLPRCMYRDWNW